MAHGCKHYTQASSEDNNVDQHQSLELYMHIMTLRTILTHERSSDCKDKGNLNRDQGFFFPSISCTCTAGAEQQEPFSEVNIYSVHLKINIALISCNRCS